MKYSLDKNLYCEIPTCADLSAFFRASHEILQPGQKKYGCMECLPTTILWGDCNDDPIKYFSPDNKKIKGRIKVPATFLLPLVSNEAIILPKR